LAQGKSGRWPKALLPVGNRLLPTGVFLVLKGLENEMMKQKHKQVRMIAGLLLGFLAGCATSVENEDDDSLRQLQERTERDCQSGNKEACALGAGLYTTRINGYGKPTAAQKAAALKFSLQACDLGAVSGCFRAIEAYEQQGDNKAARQYALKAIPLLKQDCEKGDITARSCARLGDFYREGKYVQRNEQEAFHWYEKHDEISLSNIKTKEENLRKSVAFCKQNPSAVCWNSINNLRRYLRQDKMKKLLVPHWQNMKYDAKTMRTPVPTEIIVGQWAMIPLPPLEGGIANIADFKADGTVDLHAMRCNRETRSVMHEGIEKAAWQISGNRILTFDGPKQTNTLDVKFVGTSEMTLFQEIKGDPKGGVTLDYKRTTDLQPLCAEYFDKHASKD
jgi:hypothetical protein